nr:carbon-nitrogen hydrolase family protein [Peribacillus glennii]
MEKDKTKGLVFDTCIATNSEGIVGTYRKTHLWDEENLLFTKGDSFSVSELEWGNLGVQICYEIGFPEGATALSLKGADIIVYPSSFGKARLYAWDIATRARPWENGCFVIAVNRTGID